MQNLIAHNKFFGSDPKIILFNCNRGHTSILQF